MGVAITTGRIKPQGSFLPAIDTPALPILDRVVFPGTTQVGRGVLAPADRIPGGKKPIDGQSSYTRGATTNRVGGNYPVRVGNLA